MVWSAHLAPRVLSGTAALTEAKRKTIVMLPIEELHHRVIDRLNSAQPAADRSALVTQTIYATVAELKDAGYIDTEVLGHASAATGK